MHATILRREHLATAQGSRKKQLVSRNEKGTICSPRKALLSWVPASDRKAGPAYFRFEFDNSLATSASVIISIMGSIGERTKPCFS
jgi:hypothetical protein